MAGLIPVLGIPCISRPDLLARCVASIDYPVGRLVIIDNSPDGLDDPPLPEPVRSYFMAEPPANLGFAASANLVIRTHPAAPWWAIANADTEFAPGDLARFAEAMDGDGPRCVGIVDWRIFGLNQETVDTVGFLDENFHPAFCEDADYEYRCTLAGVPLTYLVGDTTHVRSVTLGDNRYAQGNARSYPANRAYYREKWGGDLRGDERFTTPFDAGGSVRDWTLDRRRLAANEW